MVTSPGNPIEAHADLYIDRPQMPANSAKLQIDWTTQMDTDQVFRLIDSILPFEACLYHQVLPLSLEGSRLKLGMVTLEDSAALDYVRRILAYMNCSLTPHTISSEVHHSVLTAYLNYTGSRQNRQNADRARLSKPQKPHAEATPPSEEGPHAGEAKAKQHTSATHPSPGAKIDRNAAPTLLVHSPEELPPAHQIPSLLTDPAETVEIAPLPTPGPLEGTPPPHQPIQATLILQPDAPPPPEVPPQVPVPKDALPNLEVNAQHLSDPVEVLADLPPAKLLQELLGRILVGGIGRLYFERQLQQGRILWSQNGVLQSVLEELSLESFQGVIDELKQLTRFPTEPIQKPKQVEVERLYQKSRLLLRLRVMPNEYGEEATLQVLRGAALRFYQQQQIASLSRDALNIAQALQQKMNELRTRSRSYSTLPPEQLNILPAIDEVLKSVGQQLEVIRAMQINNSETQAGENE